MTRVYIVRHGEAEGNTYRRIHGQYDSDLTMNGLEQVKALEKRFADIHLDAVYSSNLRRCRKTARALYEQKGLTLQIEPDLREMDLGEWEDHTWAEIGRKDPDGIWKFQHAHPDFRAPGGENYEELRTRVSEAIFRLAAKHDGQTIGISTHYIALRSALSVFHGYSVAEIDEKIPKSDNTAVTCLEIEGRSVRFIYECDNSHLGELTTLGKQNWKKGGGIADPSFNLWYRPWKPTEEREMYLAFRRETWESVHPRDPFDGEIFYQQALAAAQEDPWAVVCAMQGDETAGILQMDLHRYEEEQAGFVFFYYITPKIREQGLGIQLLGQAISTFRPKGRKYIRLRCSPDNQHGMAFYLKHGFKKIGIAQKAPVELYLMEKQIDD